MGILEYRQTTENDYAKLVEWWNWWKFPPPPQKILPNNGRDGIMVIHEGQEVCAGFVYSTSSPILFHMEFIVSNPAIKDRKLRKEALDGLIQGLIQIVKDCGGQIIYSTLNIHQKGLLQRYQEWGWIKGSTSYEMVLPIES